MQMPHLEMHSVFGRIGMTTRNAQLEIQTAKADLTIEQPKAEMQIERTPAKIHIDQKEAWNNLNLKSAFVRIREAAEAGRQAVIEGIARRVDEGNELMAIEEGGNPIVEQARRDSLITMSYDTGHTPPFLAVKISVDPAQLHIDWQTHAPIIQSTPHAPEITYHPGQVNIYMEQYPSLTIQAVGGQVDRRV
jgi:hypothetical protein